MKYTFLLFLIIVNISAKTIYDSTQGNDTNSGFSINTPLLTWKKATQIASQGDSIFIRSGIYTTNPTSYAGVEITPDNKKTVSGSKNHPVVMMKYPKDSLNPILDCSFQGTKGLNANNRHVYGLILSNTHYWTFKNLAIRNVPQPSGKGLKGRGIFSRNSTNILFENISIYNCGGTGFHITDREFSKEYKASRALHRQNNTRFINCDSYNNYDYQSYSAGENADGFHYDRSIGTGVQFIGCRAWNNSDDGFDFYETEAPVYIENCWAFWNGYIPPEKDSAITTRNLSINGDGNGFKMGPNEKGPAHVLYKCLTVQNRMCGIDINQAKNGKQFWYNISAFDNKGQVYIDSLDKYERYNLRHYKSNYVEKRYTEPIIVLKNSIAVSGNILLLGKIDTASNILSGTTDSLFYSTDTLELIQKRKNTGELPQINFLKPKSKLLLKKGVSLKSPYKTRKPNIGCF